MMIHWINHLRLSGLQMMNYYLNFIQQVLTILGFSNQSIQFSQLNSCSGS